MCCVHVSIFMSQPQALYIIYPQGYTMPFETSSHNGFELLTFHGSQCIGALSKLTPTFTTLLQKHPGSHIVLDLSDVSEIDKSVTKLFININRRLIAAQQQLYLLHPAASYQQQLKDNSIELKILDDLAELQRNVNKDNYQKYLPCTYPENNLLRLQATCGVCGSSNVIGYCMDSNAYTFQWEQDDFFPHATTATGESFDYFGMLPIICQECFTTSIDINAFNLLDADKAMRQHSNLDDKTKLFLSKTIKKRKKMVDDIGTVIGDDFFKFPRNNTAKLYCYLLSESCARIAVVNQASISMFTVGLLNYLALQYADSTLKTELIDSCRTWLTQALNSPDEYSVVQQAQSYFILLISSLSLQKYKDLSKIMDSFSNLVEENSNVDIEINNLNNPIFWYEKADEVWKSEIAKKSSAFTM